MITNQDGMYRKRSAKVFAYILLVALCSSCSFNDKCYYVLDDTSIKLEGDLILENSSTNKYVRFNLDKNRATSLSIKTNDFGENYESFFIKDGEVKKIFKVERESATETMLYECRFPSGEKVTKILDFDNEESGYFFYSMSAQEVYYCPVLGGKGNMISLKTKEKRVIDNDYIPFLFYKGRYIIVDGEEIILSDLIDMNKNNVLFEGSAPLFCQALNSIMYTSVNEPLNTVKIYKLDDNSIVDTGITPLTGDRFDKDRYKYYFLNEPYMIYGVKDEGVVNNFKASVLNIVSGGTITDRPCKYIIYNYKTHKNVGYIKNAAVLDIKTYF